MKLKNARLFNQDCRFMTGDILVQDQYIALGTDDGREIDCTGLYAIPGLIDIHIHGCNGHEFCDCTEAALDGMAAYLIREGVTAFMPATMTVTAKAIQDICTAAGAYASKPGLCEMLGVYMEGPFISKEKCGAQNSSHIQPVTSDFFDQMQAAAQGEIKIVVLAPEKEGAADFIAARHWEVVCSVGHSTADYDTARAAFAKGARHVTHLYNGMTPATHRAPGILGAAFDSDCMVEMICDGNYVGETFIRATFKLFGDERVIMVSDGIRATGMGEGVYDFGGRTYHVRGTVAQMENGALVGPVISLRQCLQKTVREFGVPLESAMKSATLNPARQLGIDDKYGAIRPGNYADIVLLDSDLNVKLVLKKGKIAHSAMA